MYSNYKEVLARIDKLGLKKQSIATQIMVPTTVFSSYLHGSRLLTEEQETRLREYLKQFDGINV
jgi:hypothetical protein